MSRQQKETLPVKNTAEISFTDRKSNARGGFSQKTVIDHGLEPINPIQCGGHICPPSYSFGPAVRDFWLLHFVMSGKGSMTNERGTYTVKKNEVFVIRPHEKVSYCADAETPWQYVWIGFSINRPVPETLDTCDVIFAPYLRPLFEAAYSAEGFENGNTFGAYEHYLCGIVWQIIGQIMSRSHMEIDVMDAYVRPAISMMSINYSYRITVADIAAQLHISKGYFSEIFKKETGVSPKKYLNDIRMKRAAEHLLQGEHNVTTVAASVGYSDVFVFSRAFKQRYECAPSEYAKKEAEKSGENDKG